MPEADPRRAYSTPDDDAPPLPDDPRVPTLADGDPIVDRYPASGLSGGPVGRGSSAAPLPCQTVSRTGSSEKRLITRWPPSTSP